MGETVGSPARRGGPGRRVRVPAILTERLALVSITEAALRDLAAGRPGRAARRLGVHFPEGFAEQVLRRAVVRRRLADLERDPGARPWLLRLIVLRGAGPLRRERRTAVGLINFHGRPDGHGRAEIGYTVFAPYRRRSYASEAVRGMFDWAARRHRVRRFIASIAPENEPSMRLALGLGFHQVGAQIDEEDGLEFVYEAEWPVVQSPNGSA